MDELSTPGVEWLAILPILVIAGAGVVIVLGRSLAKRSPGVLAASVTTALVAIVGSFVFSASQWTQVRDDGPYTTFGGMVALDGFSVFLSIVILVAAVLAVLVSAGFVEREGFEGPEYLALILFSAAGMLAMASANDLIVVFVALEILSIPLYVLAAMDRRRADSQEAGLKYFILGAFSSAVFLYGIALVYGAVGTTQINGIADFLAANTLLDNGVLLIGVGLLIVGLGFKVAAVPFHMWAPDVYVGAPTPVTGFMAGAVKAGAFAALLRVLVGGFDVMRTDWRPIVWVLCVLSLGLGALAALTQTNVKRMLAYSSINHAGYVLIGVYVGTVDGVAGSLFYILVYTFMVTGSFTVVTLLAGRGDERHSLDDFKGVARREPVLAGVLTLMLLAQAGTPLTAGFVAKLNVFSAAVRAGDYSVAIAGVVAAVIATFFYLRVIVTMYMSGDAPDEEAPEPAEAGSLLSAVRTRVDLGAGVALAICTIAVLLIGVVPGEFWEFARDATLYLPVPT